MHNAAIRHADTEEQILLIGEGAWPDDPEDGRLVLHEATVLPVVIELGRPAVLGVIAAGAAALNPMPEFDCL